MVAMLHLISVMATAMGVLLALGTLVDWRMPNRQPDWER